MSRYICSVRIARQTHVPVCFAFAYYSTTIQPTIQWLLFRAFSIDWSHGTDCDSPLCEHRKLNRHGRGVIRRRAPSDSSSDTLVHTQIASNQDRPRFRFGRPHQGTHTHTHTTTNPTVQFWTPAPAYPHTHKTTPPLLLPTPPIVRGRIP